MPKCPFIRRCAIGGIELELIGVIRCERRQFFCRNGHFIKNRSMDEGCNCSVMVMQCQRYFIRNDFHHSAGIIDQGEGDDFAVTFAIWIILIDNQKKLCRIPGTDMCKQWADIQSEF